MSRFASVALLFAIAWSFAPVATPAQASSTKKVFAYYYSWWNRLSWDPSRMSDRPDELYDSKSETVIRRQIQQAKDAGIDGFFCTWRYSCAKVLSVAEAMGGFSVAFSVDPIGDPTLNSNANIRKNMREMMGYMSSPAYLKIDNKPVFVFWNDTILPGKVGSKGAWQQLRDDMDPNREQFWLGGGVNFGLLDVFDALHFYDITWEASSGKAMSSYNRKLNDYNNSRGTKRAGGNAIGCSCSPIPCTQALRPPKKNGTSAPKEAPKGSRRDSGQFSPQSRFNASKVVAASDEPPPKPASEGRFFCTRIKAPWDVPLDFCKAWAAFKHRSSAGKGLPRS